MFCFRFGSEAVDVGSCGAKHYNRELLFLQGRSGKAVQRGVMFLIGLSITTGLDYETQRFLRERILFEVSNYSRVILHLNVNHGKYYRFHFTNLKITDFIIIAFREADTVGDY